jgi:hypothetical protein
LQPVLADSSKKPSLTGGTMGLRYSPEHSLNINSDAFRAAEVALPQGKTG